MPQYCHNPPLGTIPNAKIRIRTLYAAATRGPRAKNWLQRCRNAPAPRSARFFAYFRSSEAWPQTDEDRSENPRMEEIDAD